MPTVYKINEISFCSLSTLEHLYSFGFHVISFIEIMVKLSRLPTSYSSRGLHDSDHYWGLFNVMVSVDYLILISVTAAMTTTTTRPSPPWLMTSQPSVWSTAKPVTVRPGPPPPPPPPVVHATSQSPPSPPAHPLPEDSDPDSVDMEPGFETTTFIHTTLPTIPSTTGQLAPIHVSFNIN